MNRIDGGLAVPALAAQFARRGRLTRGDGLGQFLAQVEIAADAFGIEAIEAEHGLRVVQVDRVFDLAASGDTVRIEERQVHRQRLQLTKLLRKGAGFFDPLTLLLTVFGAGADLVVTHSFRLFQFQLNAQLDTEMLRRL